MPHFVIAGAGIGGLAAAIFLVRQGHQVTVFEHVADPTPVGAGLLLQPSGQEMLFELGLLDSVRRLAAVVHSLEGYSGRRKTLDLHYHSVHPDWSGLGVHRAQLHRTLLFAARELGVSIKLGNGIDDFKQCSTHLIVSHQQGECNADALIIANGTRSKLRENLNVKQSYRPYPWGAYWAVLDHDSWPFPHQLMQRYRGSRVMLGVLPTGVNPNTGKTCYSLFWSLHRSLFSIRQNEGLAGLVEQIRPIWPEVADWLSQAPKTEIAIAEYADVRMSSYHQDRVLVIGDAAHSMSPQLGQGANMALIDAKILAECVAGNASINLHSAFARYSERRRKHIAYYQMASRIMTPLYQSYFPYAWIRDAGTMLGRHLPPIYRQYMLTLCGAKQGVWDLKAHIDAL
ncbi:FAD-dependent oxidoreductase [Undibacterium fentianense]|uniref:FAD-dependent monooxygenase n=1 Tax=Undibacterium fentianense TaxID=2828728 RepID=A0A941E554_9BURK|nr:NAD(P)/FAD-dependent oxidoreductase [Undibacterium fentianense]MBR7799918.1 FAD-dependent monooxygenase [Undibacterium fentianense]